MEEEKVGQEQMDIKERFSTILTQAVQVVTSPGEFFRSMPKSGGFLDPLIFMVLMGLVTGLVHTLLTLVRLSPGGTVTGFAALILVPIVVGIFGFVGAAILFVIWKVLGSRESYETAYRGMAYSAAIMPITALIGIIPYVGGIVTLAWWTFLIVTISIEVHAIKTRVAWAVFGTIAVVLAVLSLGAEIAGRKAADRMGAWEQESRQMQEQVERMQDMTPEEAGRAMGDFLRGLQEAAERQE